jgi:hypothetical protein
MKIVERKDLDVVKWDALVQSLPSNSFFSFSWYMDAVAENWCVLVDDDYQNGIALPYTIRAGQEVLYAPIFGRYAEVFGSIGEHVMLIKERFKIIEFASKHSVFDDSPDKVHQVVDSNNQWKLGSQAKRSLKKAEKMCYEVSVDEDVDGVYETICSELSGKHSGVTALTLKNLKQLFVNAKSEGRIKVFHLNGESHLGGIVCFESDSQLLYVKGSVTDSAKRNGGMYLLMKTAILYAKDNELKFDFGGSNAEGVRKFNKNLGGVDVPYYLHVENSGPFWFKMARRIKKMI